MTVRSGGKRRGDPEELGLRRAVRLYARGLPLRCPDCGRGPTVRSWFTMHPRCPACGIRTERGEEDFFLGERGMSHRLSLVNGQPLVVSRSSLAVGSWWLWGAAGGDRPSSPRRRGHGRPMEPGLGRPPGRGRGDSAAIAEPGETIS